MREFEDEGLKTFDSVVANVNTEFSSVGSSVETNVTQRVANLNSSLSTIATNLNSYLYDVVDAGDSAGRVAAIQTHFAQLEEDGAF